MPFGAGEGAPAGARQGQRPEQAPRRKRPGPTKRSRRPEPQEGPGRSRESGAGADRGSQAGRKAHTAKVAIALRPMNDGGKGHPEAEI